MIYCYVMSWCMWPSACADLCGDNGAVQCGMVMWWHDTGIKCTFLNDVKICTAVFWCSIIVIVRRIIVTRLPSPVTSRVTLSRSSPTTLHLSVATLVVNNFYAEVSLVLFCALCLIWRHFAIIPNNSQANPSLLCQLKNAAQIVQNQRVLKYLPT